MKVLGIYGSPRKGGNTDRLLDRALEGAASAGAEISRVYARDLQMSGCIACDGCAKTGKCVIKDDMQTVYPLIEEARAVILASPIYFYNVTAQAKALIDRVQALWSKRMLQKSSEERKRYDGGRGYLIAVGATRGKNLFEGTVLTARYFFDALDMAYEEGLLLRGLDRARDVQGRPDMLQQAFELGANAARQTP